MNAISRSNAAAINSSPKSGSDLIPDFKECISLAAIKHPSPPPGHYQADCSVLSVQWILDITNEFGVMPEIEILTQCVSVMAVSYTHLTLPTTPYV